MASRSDFTAGRGDRRAVLVCTGIIFAVLAGGFAYDMIHFDKWNPLGYPWFIHLHAIAYAGWLSLLVVQVLLVRSGNTALHRRLGRVAAVLLPLMFVTGPLAPLMRQSLKAEPNPLSLAFMGTQVTNVVGSIVLLTAGLLYRHRPDVHKRLMLMGTIAITEPGFGRLIADPIEAALGWGFVPHYVATYGGTLGLMLAMGAYDLASRGRPHPAWTIAFCWVVANQLLATWLFFQPFWVDWMRVLTGH